jgi:Astacin (Peptidase family M12A)
MFISASEDKKIIAAAMELLSQNTCLKFVARTNQVGYLNIKNSNAGCYSDNIGYVGEMQEINLGGSGCLIIVNFSLLLSF